MDTAPWQAQLKETNFRLEGKADRFQLEAFHAELSALGQRVKGLEAELGRVRTLGVTDQPNGKAQELVSEPQKPKMSEEVNEDDQREYVLEESAWDSLLVCGMVTYAGESVMIVVGCLLNIGIQFIYCYTVWTSLATPVITTDLLKDLAIWRVVIGRKRRSTTSSKPIRRYSASSRSSSGRLPCATWLMIVLGDMANTFDFTRAICSLPRARHSRIERSPDGSIAIGAISKRRLSVLLVSVVFPKIVIAICMGLLGVTYLVYTKSAADLLLNAIALQFVMNTDELLYTETMPLRVRGLISSMKPLAISSRLRPPERFRRLLPFRAVLLVLICSFLVTAISQTFLASELDMVSRGLEILCGGNQNFAYTTDRSTGTVVAADLSLPEKDDIFKSYLFRSVFEKTTLETAKTLEELEAPVDEILYLSVEPEQADKVERYSFQESADQIPCRDLVSSHGAYKEAFLERSEPSSGVSNCSQLEGSHCDVGLRPFCPIACGCGDPASGLFNRLGCTAQCDLVEETTFQKMLGLIKRLSDGTCTDGAVSLFSSGVGAHLEDYFEEVQNMLLQEGILMEYPKQAPGFIWISPNTMRNVLFDSFFEAFMLVNNMTLGTWAREGFDKLLQQGEPDACGMVTFVYKVFKVDLCDTWGSSLFQGKVGSIKHICMKTCGYCGDPAPPYKETTWGSLAAWTSKALASPLLQVQNLSDVGSECQYYSTFAGIKAELAESCD